MRKRTLLVLVFTAALAAPGLARAQEFRGFAGGGVASDPNGERFSSFGGGVLLDVARGWVSAGGQGELFVAWPYFAGRGALFGQVNIVPLRTVRPFFMAGAGIGESAGPLLGGGVEVRFPNHRVGLRVSVEDYLARVQGFDCAFYGYTQSFCDTNLHGGRPYTAHQVSVRFAVTF